MGSLNIKQPDDFDILIIGSAKDSKWIEEDLGGHIENGNATLKTESIWMTS